MGEAATPRRPAEQGPGAAASRGHIPAGEGPAKLPAQQSASAVAWRSPLGGTSQYYNLPHSQPFFSPRREVLFQHLPLVCKANGPHPSPKVCLCGFHSRCPAPAPLPAYRLCFASPFTLCRKPQSTARPDFILSVGALLLLC